MERIDRPASGPERDVVVGWLGFHRDALRSKCDGLDPEQLVRRAVPPSALSLLGLVRHMAEMERAWGGYALGPETEMVSVWGDYTDDGPDWDFDVNTSMVDESMAVWAAERARTDAALAAHGDLDAVPPGNGMNVRWNLQKLLQEYARHNGHADLLREAIDGQTGE
ncbi:DinB family protein [Kribbella sp. NPDC004875]|uniref:DinB family protein n=1 Tax=Kribbella sp. NPDC004875 TaxID=3364107 RepID=UPI0036756AEB